MQKRLIFADYLRGIAAIMVLFSHYISSFWNSGEIYANLVNYKAYTLHIPHYISKVTFFNGLPDFLGTGGVALFFLISGFVIAYSLDNKTFLKFWIARFFRLIPTYYFVIGINMLIVLIASKLQQKSFPYNQSEILINLTMGFPYLLKNAKVLDFVSWTLTIELFYYLFTSLTNIRFKISLKSVFIINVICLFFIELTRVFAINLNQFIVSNYLIKNLVCIPYLLCGYILYLYYSKKIDFNKFFMTLFLQIIFFIGLYNWNMEVIDWVSKEECFTWFVLILFLFLISFKYNDNLPEIKFFKWLADISYPLYVLHSYLGFFIINFLLFHNINVYLSVVMSMALVFIFAHFIHKYIELPSNIIGKKIINKIVI